ncbi:MAG: hypothetical protein OQJ82_08420 [Sulfurimonas sp.]|nr:hypothetical protein [Sulfurimonas sp.]
MRNLVQILILLNCLVSANDKNISLLDFASQLSLKNNINIYIDEDIKSKNISLYVPEKISNNDLFSVFKSSIDKLDFMLIKKGSIYYLSKKVEAPINQYLYKLKYNSFKDCDKILKSFNFPYFYLSDSNTFIITSTKKQYELIKQYLRTVDIKQSQVILKIMIFEFNNNDLKERGFKYSSIYKDELGVTEIAFNSIVAPLNTSSLTLSNTEYYGALKLLNEHNLLNVKQFPYILARNNDDFKFEAVENVPYLVTTVKTEATNTSEQTNIEYRDVGLKINGKSLIYHDYITLNLDLVIEDFMKTTLETNTPKTYKRYLKSNTNIDYNNVLLLSGIKRTKHEVTDYNIPFLSNIPYLGEIFKYKSNNESELNITIAIEVIKSNDFNNSSFIDDFSNLIEKDNTK